MKKELRIGIIGCGTIGSYVLDSVAAGKVDNAEIAVVSGRTDNSKGREKVEKYGIKWVTDFNEIMETGMDVIVEAASQKALEQYGTSILKSGICFDQTQIRILADPTVTRNTHEIECKSRAGQFKMVLENVPDPDNPKTTLMACFSVLATLKNVRSHYRVGT